MDVYFDYAFLLTFLVLLSGGMVLWDCWHMARQSKRDAARSRPRHLEYARSFFPVLLVVWLIRSFMIQPYRVPTGSLEPTILPGEFVVASQFSYGLRTPVFSYKFWKIGQPKLGDIALFRWPKDPHIIFIKRVIGTPGDHIVYKDKILFINGKMAIQKNLGLGIAIEDNGLWPVLKRLEHLPNGKEHQIFVRSETNQDETIDVIVPANSYFMMGDNRDGSDDSRYWGVVPDKNLIGKAIAIWFSWDGQQNSIRWGRIGKRIR